MKRYNVFVFHLDEESAGMDGGIFIYGEIKLKICRSQTVSLSSQLAQVKSQVEKLIILSDVE